MDKPGDESLTTEQKAAAFSNWRHINRVQELGTRIVKQLMDRLVEHDQSKLETPEVADFAEADQLSDIEYNSDEYEESVEKTLGDALAHHYANNRHHPEHFPGGVDDMNILDVLEMFLDWKAGSERTKGGNIRASIASNKERFGLSDQLVQILENSVDLIADQ